MAANHGLAEDGDDVAAASCYPSGRRQLGGSVQAPNPLPGEGSGPAFAGSAPLPVHTAQGLHFQLPPKLVVQKVLPGEAHPDGVSASGKSKGKRLQDTGQSKSGIKGSAPVPIAPKLVGTPDANAHAAPPLNYPSPSPSPDLPTTGSIHFPLPPPLRLAEHKQLAPKPPAGSYRGRGRQPSPFFTPPSLQSPAPQLVEPSATAQAWAPPNFPAAANSFPGVCYPQQPSPAPGAWGQPTNQPFTWGSQRSIYPWQQSYSSVSAPLATEELGASSHLQHTQQHGFSQFQPYFSPYSEGGMQRPMKAVPSGLMGPQRSPPFVEDLTAGPSSYPASQGKGGSQLANRASPVSLDSPSPPLDPNLEAPAGRSANPGPSALPRGPAPIAPLPPGYASPSTSQEHVPEKSKRKQSEKAQEGKAQPGSAANERMRLPEKPRGRPPVPLLEMKCGKGISLKGRKSGAVRRKINLLGEKLRSIMAELMSTPVEMMRNHEMETALAVLLTLGICGVDSRTVVELVDEGSLAEAFREEGRRQARAEASGSLPLTGKRKRVVSRVSGVSILPAVRPAGVLAQDSILEGAFANTGARSPLADKRDIKEQGETSGGFRQSATSAFKPRGFQAPVTGGAQQQEVPAGSEGEQEVPQQKAHSEGVEQEAQSEVDEEEEGDSELEPLASNEDPATTSTKPRRGAVCDAAQALAGREVGLCEFAVRPSEQSKTSGAVLEPRGLDQKFSPEEVEGLLLLRNYDRPAPIVCDGSRGAHIR